jgi:uncharacterized protein (TIGR03083 family)
MELERLPVIDTRHLFRPVGTELIALLSRLSPDDWLRPTVAGTWRVRDVVAHILDGCLRRLSFHRDGLPPPRPRLPITAEHDFVEFINELNRNWIGAATRLSPRVLTDLLSQTVLRLADFVEDIPLDSPGLFPVSWAGDEQPSPAWFDVGRDFTELWHHQAQVRLAVHAEPSRDPRYLRAALDIAVRGLPHSYRHVTAPDGATVVLVVSGPSGGSWTLQRERRTWTIWQGTPSTVDAQVVVSDEMAWRLLFNGLAVDDARKAVAIDGRSDLAEPLLRARSVIVSLQPRGR